MRNQKRLFWKKYKVLFAGLMFIAGIFVFASAFGMAAGIGIASILPIVWIKNGTFTQELTENELKKPDEDRLATYYKEYQESLQLALKTDYENLYKKSLTKDEFEKWKSDSTSNEEKMTIELKAIRDYAETMKSEIDVMKQNGGANDVNNVLKSDLEKALNGWVKSKVVEFTTKADTLRSSVANSTLAYVLPNIGQLDTPILALSQLFSEVIIGPKSGGIVRWRDWDSATIVRAAAAISEGNVFPESTAKWAEYSLPLEKVGDTIPVSEEMMMDVVWAESELKNFLQTNVMQKINTYLYTGSGSTPQTYGIYTRVNAFAHATYTGPKTAHANIMNLIDVVKSEIATTGDGKYMPNFALVSHSDYLNLLLRKDTTNRSIYDLNLLNNIGIKLIPSAYVTDNTMVIGDGNFAKVYSAEGYGIRLGYGDGDFQSDMMTMKAKKRMLFLIRNCDLGGFRKVTDVEAALLAITAA